MQSATINNRVYSEVVPYRGISPLDVNGALTVWDLTLTEWRKKIARPDFGRPDRWDHVGLYVGWL